MGFETAVDEMLYTVVHASLIIDDRGGSERDGISSMDQKETESPNGWIFAEIDANGWIGEA